MACENGECVVYEETDKSKIYQTPRRNILESLLEINWSSMEP